MKIAGTERSKGIIALIFLAIAWGILPIIPRYLTVSLTLLQQVYLRLLIALIVSYLLFRRDISFARVRQMPLRDWFLVFSRAALYYLLGVVLSTQSLLMTKISNATFIGAIPMTAVMGFLVLREKITIKKVFLVLISFLGVLAISVKDLSGVLSIGSGELVALLATLFTSLAMISRKWQTKTLNDKEISILILFLATIQIFVASFLVGEGLPIHSWNWVIIPMLFTAGVLNAGVSFFMNYGFSRVDAVMGNNILATAPIIATLLAYPLFGEVPMIIEIIGGILIITGVVLMNTFENEVGF